MIYVRCVNKAEWRWQYSKAHLRNRRGYVYLCWRDGEEFRTYYLGKAPRKSPTASGPGELKAAGDGAGELELERGARI